MLVSLTRLRFGRDLLHRTDSLHQHHQFLPLRIRLHLHRCSSSILLVEVAERHLFVILPRHICVQCPWVYHCICRETANEASLLFPSADISSFRAILRSRLSPQYDEHICEGDEWTKEEGFRSLRFVRLLNSSL